MSDRFYSKKEIIISADIDTEGVGTGGHVLIPHTEVKGVIFLGDKVPRALHDIDIDDWYNIFEAIFKPSISGIIYKFAKHGGSPLPNWDLEDMMYMTAEELMNPTNGAGSPILADPNQTTEIQTKEPR